MERRNFRREPRIDLTLGRIMGCETIPFSQQSRFCLKKVKPRKELSACAASQDCRLDQLPSLEVCKRSSQPYPSCACNSRPKIKVVRQSDYDSSIFGKPEDAAKFSLLKCGGGARQHFFFSYGVFLETSIKRTLPIDPRRAETCPTSSKREAMSNKSRNLLRLKPRDNFL
jgi:hypothetical protein